MKITFYSWFSATLVFCLFTMGSNATYAREEKVAEEIQAQFIMNYVPYTKWPRSVRKSGDPVTVCVMDGDLTAVYLRKSNENRNKQYSMRVKEKDKKSDFSECHILYLSSSYESTKEYVIGATKGKPILTISDIKGFAKSGGITGFQVTPGKDVTLEVNMESLRASAVEIDSDLLSIMKIIKK